MEQLLRDQRTRPPLGERLHGGQSPHGRGRWPIGGGPAHLVASHAGAGRPFDLTDGPLGELLGPEAVRVLEAQDARGGTVDWVGAARAPGRLVDASELGTWQGLRFPQGVAGSGKSTLMTRLGDERVGTRSSNCEAKFGLEPLYVRRGV